jgi:aminoglycoside phosphotransferase
VNFGVTMDHSSPGVWLPGSVVGFDGDTQVEVTGRPAQGTRHEVVFGRDVVSGDGVVIKLERIAGALETERCALTWLTAHAGLAPHLRSAARIRQADGASRLCLLSDLARGEAPHSEQAWERFGVALAGLSDLPWRGSGLRIHDHAEFVAGHQARIRDLGDVLSEPLKGVVDLDWLMSGPVPVAAPLVLTHGDPGPGNFLDDGGRGTLIDWEEAQVAPRGLDLARAMFIALLGVGPTGYEGRDHARRARAVSVGYLANLACSWTPGPSEMRWWLAVAAIQFAHRRWQRDGQPGVLPPRDAIETLAAALRFAIAGCTETA